MPHAIKVDSPFATPYDTARILGVSKSRTDEIVRRVKRMLHRDSETGEVTVVRAKKKAASISTRRNGERSAVTHPKKKSKSSKTPR